MKVGDKIIIAKNRMLERLEQVRRGGTEVIGPVAMPDNEINFQPLESVEQITFDYVNDYDPLKRFLTPAKEEMFRFSRNGKKPSLTPAPEPKPFVLFGARSCDVQGFAHMDIFFGGAYRDNYYWARREAMTVISLACNKPLDTCFCICCNGGPYLESGFDLQLTDLGNEFFVDVGSEKGVEFLGATESTAATAGHEQQRAELMAQCDEAMVPTAYLAKAVIQISNNRVAEKLWETMGAECFSCGGCTHVCPCCTCFYVQDIVIDDETGVRFRCWDSCQYSGFTREASDHNPRAQAKERVKRRFYHKLSYAYINQDGHPGCVGCGRCITVCEAFGLLDISAVVKRLRREGQPEPEPES